MGEWVEGQTGKWSDKVGGLFIGVFNRTAVK